MTESIILNNAKKFGKNIADIKLPPELARLYSQFSRLSSGQPGLSSWSFEEADSRFNDAIVLLETGSILKENKIKGWEKHYLRSAEIMEWLAVSNNNDSHIPFKLYSSAIYQLAGYSARANGIIKSINIKDPNTSEILASYLQANFSSVLELSIEYFYQKIKNPLTEINYSSDAIEEIVIQETIRCISLISANLRWGDIDRIHLALKKIRSIEKILKHNDNHYSWLLIFLYSQVSEVYNIFSARNYINKLDELVDNNGKIALENYVRLSYRNHKSLLWKSQILGVEKLIEEESFALCTPTASGKTTVAELAILLKLFSKKNEYLNFPFSPIAIYLVPTRALALEVEYKLSTLVKSINNEDICITSLYGGMDWGENEVQWLNNNTPTVLICTFPKAEALVRFQGLNFLNRVKLIIIDEAHNIQYEDANKPINYDTLSLKIESLSSRILSRTTKDTTIIALSAVTSGLENAISQWVTGNPEEEPVISDYRSTRQLVGRLMCFNNGSFQIQYDLLDNRDLRFEEGKEGTLYIDNPIPPLPKIEWKKGSEIELRPRVFWTAINLVKKDEKKLIQNSAVLISFTTHKNLTNYAKDFINFCKLLPVAEIPNYFELPADPNKFKLWNDTLNVCKDYFTSESTEYKLLKMGVVLHHGKLPPLLSKMLTRLVSEKICKIVMATSTLSEGINLPFEVVLIPSLDRGKREMSIREFKNLIGRAGRPGVSTEGRSLVMMYNNTKTRNIYLNLIKQVSSTAIEKIKPKSALRSLVKSIYENWLKIYPNSSFEDFLIWLENIDATTIQDDLTQNLVDNLDGFLLALIVEIEEINESFDASELEEKLAEVWKRTFAFIASSNEENLKEVFIRRAKALNYTIYPDKSIRSKIYKTGLPPVMASSVLVVYQEIIDILKAGINYPTWNVMERFNYIESLVLKINSIVPYKFTSLPEKNITIRDVLGWWLRVEWGVKRPTKDKVSKWFEYISQNLFYKFNWGLGSIISIFEQNTINVNSEDIIESSHQLPPIVLWIKELITWGTLDPVASYLLSHGKEVLRANAEALGDEYLDYHMSENTNIKEIYSIFNMTKYFKTIQIKDKESVLTSLKAELKRDFNGVVNNYYRVLPKVIDNKIVWFDPGGYLLAESTKPVYWKNDYISHYDFMLNSKTETISMTRY